MYKRSVTVSLAYFLDILTLKNKIILSWKVWETDCPVKQCHMPELWKHYKTGIIQGIS